MYKTYCAFDLVKKKQYYGSTNNLKRRIKSHLENTKEGNNLFHNVLRKRPETFLWVELCSSETRDEEQFLIDFYCPSKWVYNTSRSACGFSLNNQFAGSNKDKICIHFLDIKQIYVEKTILWEYLDQGWELGITDTALKKYNRSQNQITKQKISNTLKEKFSLLTEEERGKLLEERTGKNNGFYGKTHSEEAKNKMKVNKGRRWVNNGKENLFLRANENIPKGFKIGRLNWIKKSEY